jgi:hypothetical protein
MADGDAVLEVVVTEPLVHQKNGFTFRHEGKACYCFDVAGHQGLAQLKSGERVRISGRWSNAILDVFEGEQVEILREPGA